MNEEKLIEFIVTVSPEASALAEEWIRLQWAHYWLKIGGVAFVVIGGGYMLYRLMKWLEEDL